MVFLAEIKMEAVCTAGEVKEGASARKCYARPQCGERDVDPTVACDWCVDAVMDVAAGAWTRAGPILLCVRFVPGWSQSVSASIFWNTTEPIATRRPSVKRCRRRAQGSRKFVAPRLATRVEVFCARAKTFALCECGRIGRYLDRSRRNSIWRNGAFVDGGPAWISMGSQAEGRRGVVGPLQVESRAA